MAQFELEEDFDTYIDCTRCGFTWPEEVGCMTCEELEQHGMVKRKTGEDGSWVLETDHSTRADFPAPRPYREEPAEVISLDDYRARRLAALGPVHTLAPTQLDALPDWAKPMAAESILSSDIHGRPYSRPNGLECRNCGSPMKRANAKGIVCADCGVVFGKS